MDRNDTVFEGSVGITTNSGRIDIDKYSGVIDDNSIVIAPYQTLDVTDSINEQVFGVAAATTIPYQGNIPYSSSSDLTVANNATVTLTATDTLRRTITIGDNATLIVTAGKLNITNDLVLKNNSKIRFTTCTNLRIKDDLVTGQNPTINPDGSGVTIFVHGSDVDIDNTAKINATIYAPNATIYVADGSSSAPNIITGKLIGKIVDIGKYTNLYADNDCPCVQGSGPITIDVVKPTISCPANITITVNATGSNSQHQYGWYHSEHDNGWHYGWFYHNYGWHYNNDHGCWNNGWYDDDDDCPSATSVVLGTPSASDNVGVATVSNNHPSNIYPVGTTVVTWTATDAAGNSAVCSQTVTVICSGGHHLVNPTTAPSSSAAPAPSSSASSREVSISTVTMNAYPNPFKDNATITFILTQSTENAKLSVYNLEGTEIKQLYNGPADADVEYKFQLDADRTDPVKVNKF